MADVTEKKHLDANWLSPKIQIMQGPIHPNPSSIWQYTNREETVYLGSMFDRGHDWDTPFFDVYLEGIETFWVVWGTQVEECWDWPLVVMLNDQGKWYNRQQNDLQVAATKLLAWRLLWTLTTSQEMIARTLEAYRA